MSSEMKVDTSKKYFYFIDGTFRTEVPKGTEGSEPRDWKTPDGATGTKNELTVRALFGTIEDISFYDGDYGKNLNIILDKNEEGKNPVITTGVSSRYGESLLKLLPNLKKGVEYRFMPYLFEDSDNRGVSVYSKGEDDKYTVKVLSHFQKGEGDTRKNINGYPDPDEDDKKDWKFYYTKANKFMVKYAEEHVLPIFSEKVFDLHIPPDGTHGFNEDYPEAEIDPANIPF